MDESSPTQNRKSRRSNVLMSASLELSGTSLPVKLRNLSADGALIEGEKLPVEAVETYGRVFDLIVLGQPNPKPKDPMREPAGVDILPHELALRVGRPNGSSDRSSVARSSSLR